MKLGRKKIPAASLRVKSGFSLPRDMMDDLSYVASLTNSSRSSVIEALLEPELTDLVQQLREYVFVARTEGIDAASDYLPVDDPFLVRLFRINPSASFRLASLPVSGAEKLEQSEGVPK